LGQTECAGKRSEGDQLFQHSVSWGLVVQVLS